MNSPPVGSPDTSTNMSMPSCSISMVSGSPPDGVPVMMKERDTRPVCPGADTVSSESPLPESGTTSSQSGSAMRYDIVQVVFDSTPTDALPPA